MTLSYTIAQLVNLYSLVVFVYCIFSWFPIPREGVLADINAFLEKLVDPFLDLFRRFVPSIGGAIDISPIIAIVVLQLVAGLVIRIL